MKEKKVMFQFSLKIYEINNRAIDRLLKEV